MGEYSPSSCHYDSRTPGSYRRTACIILSADLCISRPHCVEGGAGQCKFWRTGSKRTTCGAFEGTSRASQSDEVFARLGSLSGYMRCPGYLAVHPPRPPTPFTSSIHILAFPQLLRSQTADIVMATLFKAMQAPRRRRYAANSNASTRLTFDGLCPPRGSPTLPSGTQTNPFTEMQATVPVKS